MTRKQALKQAILLLSGNPENTEVIEKLQDIHNELPLIHWSDKSIRDSVEEFILTYGRVPTATDFKKAGMPPHTVIKQKYKITLSEWLEKYYPTPKPSFKELKAKYTADFLIDYDRIKPKSQQEFNRNKRPETRGWQTLAFYYNVKSWRKLIKTLGLPLYFEMHRDRKPANLTVNIYTDYDFKE